MNIKDTCSSQRYFWVVWLNMLAWLALGLGPVQAMGSLTNQQRKKAVQDLYENYKKCFPEIPEITPEETMRLMQEDQAVLVDVRPAVERQVSMLPGAISINEFLKTPDSYAGKTIIAYDTVGYRGGLCADRLKKKGYCLANLQGGLLGWLHAGGKIYDDDCHETRRVHVYSCMWNYAPAGYETLR